jgi:hypothetical protein
VTERRRVVCARVKPQAMRMKHLSHSPYRRTCKKSDDFKRERFKKEKNKTKQKRKEEESSSCSSFYSSFISSQQIMFDFSFIRPFFSI